MGVIVLSDPVSGTLADATVIANNNSAIKAAINGGIDNNNFAAGKIFDPSKLMQNGATTGQALLWNGSNWAPGAATKTTVSALSGGPPASPSTGDIWIATAAGTNGEAWTFVYNAAETTYKWEFIGGSPVPFYNGSSNTITTNVTPVNSGYGTVLTLPRSGDYEITFGGIFTDPGFNNNYFEIYVAGATQSGVGGRITMLQNSGAPAQTLSLQRTFVGRGYASGSIVQLFGYNSNGTSNVTVGEFFCSMRPIRII